MFHYIIVIDCEEAVMPIRNRPAGRAVKKGTGPKVMALVKHRASRKPPGANPPKNKPSSDKR